MTTLKALKLSLILESLKEAFGTARFPALLAHMAKLPVKDFVAVANVAIGGEGHKAIRSRAAGIRALNSRHGSILEVHAKARFMAGRSAA